MFWCEECGSGDPDIPGLHSRDCNLAFFAAIRALISLWDPRLPEVIDWNARIRGR